MILGRLPAEAANLFVSQHPFASLGSRSKDGSRRVIGPEDLTAVFAASGGVMASPMLAVESSGECVPCQQAKLGDKIAAGLKAMAGKQVPCEACQQEIDRLNAMSMEEVEAELPALSHRMVERAATSASHLSQRLAARVAPALVAKHLRNVMAEAIRSEHVGLEQEAE